jgi:hypothetical protein
MDFLDELRLQPIRWPGPGLAVQVRSAGWPNETYVASSSKALDMLKKSKALAIKKKPPKKTVLKKGKGLDVN